MDRRLGPQKLNPYQMESTTAFLVSIGLRRQMRVHLKQAGIPFEEEKGWLDSVFIARTDPQQRLWLNRLIQHYGG